MREAQADATGLEDRSSGGSMLQAVEIPAVFVIGISTLFLGVTIFGDHPMVSVGSIWAANLLMLTVIYGGLRSRGQDFAHLGLPFGWPRLQSIGLAIALSLPVFAFALVAFIAGAILMAILVGVPEQADLGKYNALQGNLTLTLLALGSVYVVSAFAEEVIYRGFLITRLSELLKGGKSASCVAVIVSGLIFGLIHSDWGIAGMVQATCMGLAMGVAYLFVNRNLWVTILAHAYMDTILVLQMYFSA